MESREIGAYLRSAIAGHKTLKGAVRPQFSTGKEGKLSPSEKQTTFAKNNKPP